MHPHRILPEASGSPWKKTKQNTRLHNCPAAWAFYNHTSTKIHIWELIALKPNIFTHLCTVYTQSSSILGGRGLSEVEKVDKILRRQRRGAAFGVVGCARMVCVLWGRKTKHARRLNSNGFARVYLQRFCSKSLIKWKNKHAHLPEKDVAVCAEMQRVAVLLSVRITAAQLEVHLLPLQVTLLAHHQTLTDLRRGTQTEILL